MKVTTSFPFFNPKWNKIEVNETPEEMLKGMIGETKKKKSNIQVFFNTFRISKETKAYVLKKHACEFWVFLLLKRASIINNIL